MTACRLDDCEEALGYRFKNRAYLKLALVHSSDKSTHHLSDDEAGALACHTKAADNERLEFLGDAVLGFVVSDHLYRTCPDRAEGRLTHIKSIVVSRRTLSVIARTMKLERFISVGKGMERDNALPGSIMANLFEALVAAVFLDGGIRAARRFVLRSLKPEIEAVEKKTHVKNYKSLLQQYTQRVEGATPSYRVIEEVGPDHAKEFVVSAVVAGAEYPAGRGSSKKAAQQKAAEMALEEMMRREDGIEKPLDLIDS